MAVTLSFLDSNLLAMSPSIVITGASSGIGFEVAKLLSNDHCCLLVSRSDPGISNTVWKQCDLSCKEQINDLLDFFSSQIKEVKLLVHAAGIMRSSSSASLSLEDCVDSFMVNSIAPMVITSALAKKISKSKGVAIAISSIASKLDIPGESVYSASKSALDKGFEILAADLSRLGGTYLKLHPCMIDTRMTADLSSEQKDYMDQHRTTKLQPSAHDLASFIASLLDAPQWITGSSILFGGLRR